MSKSIKYGINLTSGNLATTSIVSTNFTTGAIYATDISAGNINFTGNLYQNGSVFVSGTGGSGVSSQWTSSNGNLYYTTTAGNSFVGINTSSPTSTIDVSGSARVTVGITTGAIRATGMISANSLNSTTFSAGSISVDNLKSTNITATNGLISNASASSMLGANASINNMSTTNASIGSVVATNINATNISATNTIVTNGVITNVSSSNVLATNLSSANSVITTILSTNVSLGSLLVDQGGGAFNLKVKGSNPDGALIIHENTGTNGLTYAVGSFKDSESGTGYGIYDATNSKQRMIIAENGDLTINATGNVGGVINFGDSDHAIWGRLGVSGVENVMQFRSKDQFQFFNGGLLNDQTRKMLIQSDGKVSASTLALSGDLSSPNVSGGSIRVAGSATTSNLRITNADNNRSILLVEQVVEGSRAIGANNNAMQYQVGTGAHQFYTNSTSGPSNEALGIERMRIAGNGNIGIGTLDPSKKLHVVGDVLINGLVTASNIITSNVSTSSLNSSNISVSTLITTNVSVGSIVTASVSANTSDFNNINSTSISSNNFVTTNNASSGTLSGGSINAPNVISTNMSASTLIVSGMTATSISTGTLIGNDQASLFSITTGNIDAAGIVRVKGDLYVSGSISAVNVTSVNLIQNNISSGTLSVSGISSLQNITAANVYGSNVYATFVSSSNLATSNATVSNLISNNISSSNIISTLVSSGNVSGVNGRINTVVSNLITANNLIATNITNNSLYIFNSATSGNANYSITALANITSGSRVGTIFGKNGDFLNGLYTWYEHVGDANPLNHVHHDFNGYNNVLIMNAQGRVGLSTNLPTDSLHVNGSMRVDELITTSNLIVTSASIGNLVSTLITSANLVATNITTAELVTTDITSVNTVTTSASIGTLIAPGNRNTLGSLFTIDGSVGIGTTSPSSMLDVQLDGSTSILLRNLNVTNPSTLRMVSFTDKRSYIQAPGNLTFSPMDQAVLPRLSIATTGNVGIANTAPINTLDVNGSLRVTELITTSNLIASNVTSNNLVTTNITANGVVSLQSTRGLLIGTSTNIDDGRFISALDSGQPTNSNRHIAFGQAAGTNNQAELTFSYIGSGNELNSLNLGFHGGERMRIQANGRIGIATNAPAYKLDISDSAATETMRIQNDNANGYATIRYEATGSTWYAGVGGTNTGTTANKFYIGSGGGANFRGQTNGNWGVNIDNATSTLHVNGSIAKTSGTFDIKHPTNENKRLIHSFVESPRCDLIYRGRKQLVNGQAIVNIDLECTNSIEGSMSEGTFEALCANPQVLVCSNTRFEKIIGSVSNNKLTIQSNNPSSDIIIDWMVIAERKDEGIKIWDKTDANGFLITEYDV